MAKAALPQPIASALATPAQTDLDLAAISPAQVMAMPARLRWKIVGHLRVTRDYAQAEALLDAIEAQTGESATLLDERARLAFAMDKPDQAVALLERRAELWPSATSETALAHLHLALGHLDEAHAIADSLVAEAPNLMTVRHLAADVARAEGQPSSARAHLEHILALQPEHPTTLLKLAEVANEGGDAAGALALFVTALDHEEMMTSGQFKSAASVAASLGQHADAARLQQRARTMETEREHAFLESVRQALPLEPINELQAPVADGYSDAPPPEDAPSPTSLATPTQPAPLDPEVTATLREMFGHKELRPGQADVIARVLAGRDTLAIMPTGAGKSLTFQLPAMLLPGATVVISPLIALMKDQVESLPDPVRAETTLINSTLPLDEMRRRLAAIANGAYRLIYAAPERLRHHGFLEALRARGISLVVVDEAHCITHWGHDFRPDYLSIPTALTALGKPAILAITATATPAMARAISEGLGRPLERVQISLFRPNLFYEVHQLPNREAKMSKLIALCRELRGTGIVYVSSRRDTETISTLLRDRGVNAVPYHAGLDPETRARNQERFMRGQVRVIVATVAFGMGVNKADVRFIIHLSPPRSLEAYAQESGRAGRDGKPARCVLLISPTDRATLLRVARRDEMDLETLRAVYARLKRQAAGRWVITNPDQLIVTSPDQDPYNEPDPRVAIGILEQASLLRRHPDTAATRTVRLANGLFPPSANGTEPVADATAAQWQRFAAWADLTDSGAISQFRTVDACAANDLTPSELDFLLSTRPDITVRDGPRLACLELLPVSEQISGRMNELLLELRQTAERRIAQVIGYASSSGCRHVQLARHLGETLPPCRTACDNCTKSQTADQPETTGPAQSQTRAAITAADALATLDAVRHLPFQMGKPGLTKLLAGSVESRVRSDRSSSFGALRELGRSKIGHLIDQLVSDGFLERDLNHEFKIIRLTRKGAAATEADLAAYEQTKPGRSRGLAPDQHVALSSLSDADRELFDRLRAWRAQEAAAASLPPYVIAHDQMLLAVAAAHPTTPDELLKLSGFGQRRVEQHGAAILSLVAGESPDASENQ